MEVPHRAAAHLAVVGVAEAERAGAAHAHEGLEDPAEEHHVDGRRGAEERHRGRHERLRRDRVEGGADAHADVGALRVVQETEPEAEAAVLGAAELVAEHAARGELEAPLAAEVLHLPADVVDSGVGRGVAPGQLLVVRDEDAVELALAGDEERRAGAVDLGVVVQGLDVLLDEGQAAVDEAVARVLADDGALHDGGAGDGLHHVLLPGPDLRGAGGLEAEAREALVADRDRDLRPDGARGPAGGLAVDGAAGHVVAERRRRRALLLRVRVEREEQGGDGRGDGGTEANVHGVTPAVELLTTRTTFLLGRHETEPSQLILSLWLVATRK